MSVCKKNFFSGDTTDYVAHERTVITFSPFKSKLCVPVEVLNDCVIEADEEFNILLRRSNNLDSRIIIDPDQAEVVITDNDGTYIIYIMDAV